MTLCISILLALVVFLLLVSKILPPTSISIPLISKFLLFTFIMNIFTILITVGIINWNFRTPRTHRMPNWVRVVFMQYLPLVLLMKRPDHIEEMEAKRKSAKMASAEQIRCNGKLMETFSEPRPSQPAQSNQQRFYSNPHSWTRVKEIASSPKLKDSHAIREVLKEEILPLNQPYSAFSRYSSTKEYSNIQAHTQLNTRRNIDSSDFLEMTSLTVEPIIPNPLGNPYIDTVDLNSPSSLASGVIYEEGLPPDSTPFHSPRNKSGRDVGLNQPESSQMNLRRDEHTTANQDTFHSSHHPHCRITNLSPLHFHTSSSRNRTTSTTKKNSGPSTSSATYPPIFTDSCHSDKTPTTGNKDDAEEDKETPELRYNGVKISRDMRRAITAINFIAKHLRVETEYNRILQDWKYVASVIDRIQLVIFVSACVVGTFSIIMNAPYILEYVDQQAIIKKYS